MEETSIHLIIVECMDKIRSQVNSLPSEMSIKELSMV